MSTYNRQTKHPKTGEWEDATWRDDFFGPHHYGVIFPSEKLMAFDPEVVELETRESPPLNPPTEVEKDRKQCEWYKTGSGSSKNLHTCRPSCSQKLFVEGAGEFYCNNYLPCSKHSAKENPTEGNCCANCAVFPKESEYGCAGTCSCHNSLKEGWARKIADILFEHHYPNMEKFLPEDSHAIAQIALLITTSLQQQKERIVEELGKLKYDNSTRPLPRAYNEGIDECVQTIKNLK
jgi:hypothetical protein